MESIIDKIRKVKALADAGKMGEATAAQCMLDKLLEKHGLTIDQLFDDQKQRREFFCKNKHEHHILCQIYFKVTDSHNMKYRESKQKIPGSTKRVISIELTNHDYAEIKNLYEWHCNNYQVEWEKTRKSFDTAYTSAHGLFPESDDPNPSNRKSKMTYEEALAAMAMAETIKKGNKFQKQLEG